MIFALCLDSLLIMSNMIGRGGPSIHNVKYRTRLYVLGHSGVSLGKV